VNFPPERICPRKGFLSLVEHLSPLGFYWPVQLDVYTNNSALLIMWLYAVYGNDISIEWSDCYNDWLVFRLPS